MATVSLWAVDHNIDYLTLYAHLGTITIQEGQIVGKGQLLGTVGSTGNSTGPHLPNFEIARSATSASVSIR